MTADGHNGHATVRRNDASDIIPIVQVSSRAQTVRL